MRNLEDLLGRHRDGERELGDITVKQLQIFYQLEIQNSVQNLVSLQLDQ